MNELHTLSIIHLAAQVSHMDINNIVERRDAMRLAPDIFSEHLTRHRLSLMAHKVSEQIELTWGEQNLVRSTFGATVLDVER